MTRNKNSYKLLFYVASRISYNIKPETTPVRTPRAVSNNNSLFPICNFKMRLETSSESSFFFGMVRPMKFTVFDCRLIQRGKKQKSAETAFFSLSVLPFKPNAIMWCVVWFHFRYWGKIFFYFVVSLPFVAEKVNNFCWGKGRLSVGQTKFFLWQKRVIDKSFYRCMRSHCSMSYYRIAYTNFSLMNIKGSYRQDAWR